MSAKNGKRSFVIAGSDIGFTGGLYKNRTPIAAGRKAGKTLLRMVENKDNNPEWHKYHAHKDAKSVKFILRESTMGSAKKTYFYEASVVHFKEPKIIERDGKQIAVSKKVIVKTCNDHLADAVHTYKSSMH